MSRIVTTKFGRFRGIADGEGKGWLWECPRCKTWGNLNQDQWDGKVSVYCTAPVRPNAPGYRHDEHFPCGYHETHEFAKELAVTVQTRVFFGEPPFEEDTP